MRYVFVLLFPLILFSQWRVVWEMRYNGTGNWADYPTAISITDDRPLFCYIVVTGMSYGDTSYYDFLTLKYSFAGGLVWERRYNSEFNGYDAATGLKVDGTGNVFVTGYSQGIYGYDFLTLKYNNLGQLLWERRYNGPGNSEDIPYCLELDRYGNLYVAGISFFNSLRAYDALLVKYSPNGETLWTRFYNNDSNGNDIPQAMAIDRNGNILLALYSWGGERNKFDYLLLKYNLNGELLFAKRFNGPGNDDDYPREILVTENGEIYLTGTSLGANADYWTLKLDSLGNILWERRFDRGRDDHLWAMSYVSCYRICCVTGYSYSPISGYDIMTVGYDAIGNEIWRQIYDGGGDDFAYGIADRDWSMGMLVTGCSKRREGDYDLISLIYDDRSGREVFRHRYNGQAGRNDYGRVCANLPHNDLIAVAGYSEGMGSYYDYYTVLYHYPAGMEDANSSPIQKKDGGKVFLYDIMGRKVKDISFSELPRGPGYSKLSLPPGVYILREEGGITKKVVIQK